MLSPINHIRAILNIPDFDAASAHLKMAPLPRAVRRPAQRPGRARVGAVLVLLYNKSQAIHLVLTRRRDDLAEHSGQIAFPGGKQEPGEALADTALREAHEEIGILPSEVLLLGQLTPIYIPPSDFEVHPFVGWHNAAPHFDYQPGEVAELLEVPLALLLDPATRQSEQWEMGDLRVDVPFYAVAGRKVWGATAIMLSELLERWRWNGHAGPDA